MAGGTETQNQASVQEMMDQLRRSSEAAPQAKKANTQPPEDQIAREVRVILEGEDFKNWSEEHKTKGNKKSVFDTTSTRLDALKKAEAKLETVTKGLTAAEAVREKYPKSSKQYRAETLKVEQLRQEYQQAEKERTEALSKFSTEAKKIYGELQSATQTVKEYMQLIRKNAMESFNQWYERQMRRSSSLVKVVDEKTGTSHRALVITRLDERHLSETIRFDEAVLDGSRDPKGAWFILLLVIAELFKRKWQKLGEDPYLRAAREMLDTLNKMSAKDGITYELDLTNPRQIRFRGKDRNGQYIDLTEEQAQQLTQHLQSQFNSNQARYKNADVTFRGGASVSANFDVKPKTSDALAPAKTIQRSEQQPKATAPEVI